jgi:hypothetical protein
MVAMVSPLIGETSREDDRSSLLGRRVSGEVFSPVFRRKDAPHSPVAVRIAPAEFALFVIPG